MITFDNGKETIKVNFKNIIIGNNVNSFKKKYYTLELPEITCSNEDTAVFLQKNINEYVSNLLKSITK